MDTDQRDELIAAYFQALDAESFDRLEDHLAVGFTYDHPDTTAETIKGMRTFFEQRAPQDTSHEIHRTLHAAKASVVEGRITGELVDGTPREGYFCDVFDFDDGEDHLTRVAVYPML